MKKILKKKIKYNDNVVRYFSGELLKEESKDKGTHPWYGPLTCSVGCPD